MTINPESPKSPNAVYICGLGTIVYLRFNDVPLFCMQYEISFNKDIQNFVLFAYGEQLIVRKFHLYRNECRMAEIIVMKMALKTFPRAYISNAYMAIFIHRPSSSYAKKVERCP